MSVSANVSNVDNNTVTKCISVISRISTEEGKIVVNNHSDQRIITRALGQVHYSMKGLVPTFPARCEECVNGVNCENMTIFHCLCLVGVIKDEKPSPMACGCFFVHTQEEIKANIEATRVAIGRPKLAASIAEGVEILKTASGRYTLSKDSRCFFDLVKSKEAKKAVFVHDMHPIYGEDVFVTKKESFPTMEPPKPKSTGGVVTNCTNTFSTKSWGAPNGVSAIVSKSVITKRIHVKPDTIRKENDELRAALENLKKCVAEREKEAEEALAASKALEERKILLALIEEQKAKLAEHDNIVNKAIP
jgi:hypothetical protein